VNGAACQITVAFVRKPKLSSRRVRRVPFSLFVVASAIVGTLGGLALVYSADLPEIHDLSLYRPISNTVLYDDKGREFGSFALQRRVIAQYEDFPKVLYDAVLSIEDKSFERHPGIELWRMLVAAGHDLRSGAATQGASTLTMQLARNLFLSPERTAGRKFREILLALQIERLLTKNQIFTLYANQIYLGHGVYGFATGSEYYFGKSVKNLTLEEAAMLAALPKAPNTYSPVRNPARALRRRNVVIDAMIADGRISKIAGAAAKNIPIRLQVHYDPNSLAPYFVEEIRQYLETKYGTEQVHEAGLRVYTTLDVDLQKAANTAVLSGLAKYERRHGWRAHPPHRPAGTATNGDNTPDWHVPVEPGDYTYAEVISVSQKSALLRVGQYNATIGPSDVEWTRHMLPGILSVGDVAYVRVIAIEADGRARVSFEEDSGVQGALLAIDSASGEVKAMVGGRDFNQSKFNRATQALRQVGSSFKPYVYTAAIDQGATPEDAVMDVPATFLTPSGPYTPHNYDEKFEGSITLRHALAESRNIPALRLAHTMGIKAVIDYARRFGINERIPPYLPVALGAVELTLLEHTSAFSTFPNDGLRAIPHYIVKVTDYDGRILEQNYPAVQNVISSRTARTMTSMLQDVVLHGTGVAAARLKYPVAGKTGTTNDFKDAWFIGFSPSITCGVWVGFDEKKTLGNKETGAMAALPIWMDFMEAALPQQGARRDFLPVPEKSDPMLARHADDLSIGQAIKNSSRESDDELPHLPLERASKRTVERLNSLAAPRQDH
jgi:penicillin-binding protein 1A